MTLTVLWVVFCKKIEAQNDTAHLGSAICAPKQVKEVLDDRMMTAMWKILTVSGFGSSYKGAGQCVQREKEISRANDDAGAEITHSVAVRCRLQDSIPIAGHLHKLNDVHACTQAGTREY